jgi:ABC-type methionine transport system ATPase subunit
MAAKKKKAAPKRKAPVRKRSDSNEIRRLWLMYPPARIQTPLIWELGNKFKLVTNVRQASVNDELGIVCLEISGKRESIKKAIKWLEQKEITVDPVEISVIES